MKRFIDILAIQSIGIGLYVVSSNFFQQPYLTTGGGVILIFIGIVITFILSY